MSGALHYVHGYGFALGNKALDLDGDGPITDDKRLLVDAFAELLAKVAELERHLERVAKVREEHADLEEALRAACGRVAELAREVHQLRHPTVGSLLRELDELRGKKP